MKRYTYYTTGTCSQRIDFAIDDNDRVTGVQFLGGCNGNLQGICRLVEGKPREEVINTLKGIRCGAKPTSCPDQLATALAQAAGE